MKTRISRHFGLKTLTFAAFVCCSTSQSLASTFYYYSGPSFQTSFGLTAPRITALFEFSDAIPSGTTLLLTSPTFLGSWISAGNYGISHTVNPPIHGTNEYLTVNNFGQIIGWKFRDTIFYQGLVTAANSENSSTLVQDFFTVQPISSGSFAAAGQVNNIVGQWAVSTSPIPEPSGAFLWLTSALAFAASRFITGSCRIPKRLLGTSAA